MMGVWARRLLPLTVFAAVVVADAQGPQPAPFKVVEKLKGISTKYGSAKRYEFSGDMVIDGREGNAGVASLIGEAKIEAAFGEDGRYLFQIHPKHAAEYVMRNPMVIRRASHLMARKNSRSIGSNANSIPHESSATTAHACCIAGQLGFDFSWRPCIADRIAWHLVPVGFQIFQNGETMRFQVHAFFLTHRIN